MNIGASGIVINEFGQVLLIQRDDTCTWAMPGGSLDAGELPNDAAAREVEEETGLKVLPVRLAGMDYWPNQPDGFLIFSFRCLVRGGQLAASAESLQVGFFARDPLPRPMLAMHEHRLRQAMNHAGGPVYWNRRSFTPPERVGKFLLFNLLYPLKDWQRRWRGEPPFVKAPPWRVAAFTVIRNEQGAVLWVKRRDDGRWNLPGGGTEPLEAPWETAVRETREETGLAIRLTNLRGVYIKPAHNEMIFSFSATVTGGRLTTGPEAVEFGYFAPGQEPANSLPNQVARVADAVSPAEHTIFRLIKGMNDGREQRR
jgi:8-oxo-dGTP pyrophosphatase MutT (NUDIX family)